MFVPVILLCHAVAALLSSQTADALPAPLIVEYRIYETRGDEASPLEWTVSVELRAVGRDGKTVMWCIKSVVFDEAATQWSWRYAPEPKIADWAIRHLDPLAPVASEFAELPEIAGVASPDDSGAPGLDFWVTGRNPTLSRVEEFWWTIEYASESAPRSSGEAQPVFLAIGDVPQ